MVSVLSPLLWVWDPPGVAWGSRGGSLTPRYPPEAAVLLALLGSLPQELGALDRTALDSHLRGSYSALTAPHPPATAPTAPLAPGTAPTDGWKGVGLCPLNLFLVPLRLLARTGPSG